MESHRRGGIILDRDFRKTLNDLKSSNISLPATSNSGGVDFSGMNFPSSGELQEELGSIKKVRLDPINGKRLYSTVRPILAYDESILTYEALEGIAVMTAHSLIELEESDYSPMMKVTLRFYSRAKKLSENKSALVYAVDPSAESKRDYARDRNSFILDMVKGNSVVFIDGPLLGGQMSQQTVQLNDRLLDRGIVPIFLVKNSNSDLVRDHFPILQERFNSDMHWAYTFLAVGERTSELRYQDTYNTGFGKVFFYLKAFNLSPLRVEVHKKNF